MMSDIHAGIAHSTFAVVFNMKHPNVKSLGQTVHIVQLFFNYNKSLVTPWDPISTLVTLNSNPW